MSTQVVSWGYRFDAAIQSPSGRYSVIYERLGTKALLLDRGEILRELNRSFYHADVYEFPVVLFADPDGRELIAHCPEEYNRIEIDEIATGRRLTVATNRMPDDFFHSRLAASPDGHWLLSAGWIWHPANALAVWSIPDCLSDSRTLDRIGPVDDACRAEINSAAFVDANRLLLSSSPNAQELGKREVPTLRPGMLAIFNLATNEFESTTPIDEPLGHMLWLGDDRIVSFYEMPKLVDARTGSVLFRWADLATAKQDSSIIGHLDHIPTLALDTARKRFAVAQKSGIRVIQF